MDTLVIDNWEEDGLSGMRQTRTAETEPASVSPLTLEVCFALRWEDACLPQGIETFELLDGQGQIANLTSQLQELGALLENAEVRHNMLAQ